MIYYIAHRMQWSLIQVIEIIFWPGSIPAVDEIRRGHYWKRHRGVDAADVWSRPDFWLDPLVIFMLFICCSYWKCFLWSIFYHSDMDKIWTSLTLSFGGLWKWMKMVLHFQVKPWAICTPKADAALTIGEWIGIVDMAMQRLARPWGNEIPFLLYFSAWSYEILGHKVNQAYRSLCFSLLANNGNPTNLLFADNGWNLTSHCTTSSSYIPAHLDIQVCFYMWTEQLTWHCPDLLCVSLCREGICHRDIKFGA